MRGMPLLMCATKPMQGPMVPVISRLKKVRADGLVPQDRVAIYGWKGSVRELIHQIENAVTLDLEIHTDEYGYLQVELFNTSRGLYLWLE